MYKASAKVRPPLAEEDLSRKDNRFLRYLVHHDYQANKTPIIMRQVKFMEEDDPEAQPFYTEFDYTEGNVKFNVYPMQYLPSLLTTDAARAVWSDHYARMARDPGRMQLHVALTWAQSSPVLGVPSPFG
ncbi:hypothetical protein FB451DRAFT_1180767 [Mycena latifolia]|nr:hypothetical protein FB451DRAFT_1180767 [Mycena latifolia]